MNAAEPPVAHAEDNVTRTSSIHDLRHQSIKVVRCPSVTAQSLQSLFGRPGNTIKLNNFRVLSADIHDGSSLLGQIIYALRVAGNLGNLLIGILEIDASVTGSNGVLNVIFRGVCLRECISDDFLKRIGACSQIDDGYAREFFFVV